MNEWMNEWMTFCSSTRNHTTHLFHMPNQRMHGALLHPCVHFHGVVLRQNDSFFLLSCIKHIFFCPFPKPHFCNKRVWYLDLFENLSCMFLSLMSSEMSSIRWWKVCFLNFSSHGTGVLNIIVGIADRITTQQQLDQVSTVLLSFLAVGMIWVTTVLLSFLWYWYSMFHRIGVIKDKIICTLLCHNLELG
jgi:hypothetical protein